jgi:hypothetical protein
VNPLDLEIYVLVGLLLVVCVAGALRSLRR